MLPGQLQDEGTYWHERMGLTRFRKLKGVDLMQSRHSLFSLGLGRLDYSYVQLKLLMNGPSIYNTQESQNIRT